MPTTTYPPTWVERVKNAEKLRLDDETGLYRSPDGQQQVRSNVVEDRTDGYLKLELARRRRKLSKEDEQVCREYVLLVDNWRTGNWEQRAKETAESVVARSSKRRANGS